MNTRNSKRPRWIVPATLLLALGITAMIVLAVSGGTARKPATASGQVGPAQTCPAGQVSDAIPAAPPSDLVWKNIAGMLVPTSPTAGPTRYQGPVWSCYAHTPAGAVMAAYDIFAGLISPDWHTIAESEIVPGPGQQAYITASESQPYQAVPPGDIPQAIGFEVVGYTAQQATIETLQDGGQNGYQANQLTVAWDDEDWKLVVTPDGSSGPDPQLVTSTDGFVLWGENDG
ncbi:MAG TPA: hypothetical protein VN969_42795 [Streptosporangiaceae bacterium]|nr:hypothetical protein [Streptosporangiaceae bacterium]